MGKGAERVSLAPNWTPRGISLHEACSQVYWPASLTAAVRLGRVSLSLTRCLDTRSGCLRDGDGRTRRACAAPPLSLTRTGESTGLSQPYEADSMRAQHYF